MSNTKLYDIVVFGASGYTGRLVCEYLNREYGDTQLSWAMAGRSLENLAAVRTEMALPESTPLIKTDSADSAAVAALVDSTKVVITTVGPYQLYGEELVRQCAERGTDYVDLCGEPGWMHDMIAAHQASARASGARIVFSCGFDSIPFDLGVYLLQQHAATTTGKPLKTVNGRVRSMVGTFSGGTVASLKATMAAVGKRPELIGILTNPFTLCEGFTGPTQPAGDKPQYDEALKSWSAPFIMAAINTKNVHRSNKLLGFPYGDDFSYDEMLFTGDGEKGKAAAEFVANDNSFAENTRQPGEGPSKEERENGSYDILFVGQTASGELLKVGVTGDKDPGYGSTSKMLTEAALCLASDPALASGGMWTPAAALGNALIKRLEDHAGLTFTIE